MVDVQEMNELENMGGSSKWKPYPTYKDSGAEWLGEVPEHWDVQRLKYRANVSFSSVDKHSFEDEATASLCNYNDVYQNEFITNQLDFMKATASIAEIRRFTLKQGDVLVTKDSESWNDIAVPAYVISDLHEIICGYHLALVRPNHTLLLGNYLFRAFQAVSVNHQFQIAANGITRYGIGKYAIDNGLFPIPLIDEQRAIANFLDRETAKIDTLIAKKQRLIELLQEKRTALISQAVTKGLDPNAPMKDSGVEWLGKVPEHWEIFPLKRLGMIRYGLGQPPKEQSDGKPLIRATNINSGKITDEGMMYIDPQDVPDSRGAELQEGEIIIVRSGAYTGDSAIVPSEYAGAIAGYDMIFTLRNGNNGYFAWQILSSHVRELQFNFHKLRAAQPHLNAEELKDTIVVVPSTDEQISIKSFLDYETAKIDKLDAKVQSAIQHLQEYRSALISAAVTGKIDVRRFDQSIIDSQ